MGVTVSDIAKACNVSRGTVDRALNNKGGINEATKAMILNTVKDMGYRPDLLARSLVKGKTMSIGVVVFDIRNRIFAQLLNSIEATARKNGYYVNIMLQEEDPELEMQLINNLVDRRVDGIIVCPVNKGKDFCEYLNKLGTPVVSIGNRLSLEIPYIGIDECRAAQDATEVIIEKGYKTIFFVCPALENKEKENVYSHEERLRGFLSVIDKKNGITYQILDNNNYLKIIESRIKESSDKIAAFCSGDIYALEIIKYLRKRGISVPSDIGIMGFDGIDTLEYVVPALSTVYYPVEEIGVKSVDTLLKIITEEEIQNNILVDYKIISGDSL